MALFLLLCTNEKYAELSNSSFWICVDKLKIVKKEEISSNQRHIHAQSHMHAHAHLVVKRTATKHETQTPITGATVRSSLFFSLTHNHSLSLRWNFVIFFQFYFIFSLSSSIAAKVSGCNLQHSITFSVHTYSYDSRSFFVIMLPRSRKSSTIKSANVPL